MLDLLQLIYEGSPFDNRARHVKAVLTRGAFVRCVDCGWPQAQAGAVHATAVGGTSHVRKHPGARSCCEKYMENPGEAQPFTVSVTGNDLKKAYVCLCCLWRSKTVPSHVQHMKEHTVFEALVYSLPLRHPVYRVLVTAGQLHVPEFEGWLTLDKDASNQTKRHRYWVALAYDFMALGKGALKKPEMSLLA